jgi:ribosomal protein S18 acetylase RimI-like enzyme
MTPQLAQDPASWQAVLSLIQSEFAYMQDRIDPPSSMQRLNLTALATQSETGEIWTLGTPPLACVFLTRKADALYIGKLAVRADQRGRGLARRLIAQAEARARALGLRWCELETRVELVENQASFRAMGFVETARKAHAGFDRPTSITFRKPVPEV